MLSWLNFFGKDNKKSSLPSLRDIKDLKGKRVLLRASLNAPVKDGVVTEKFRVQEAIPTIEYLKSHGARVIVIGHIGREPEETLKPVFDVLSQSIEAKWGGTSTDLVSSLGEGEVLVLENVRRDPRESANDDALAKELASLADIYVNDAFADSHREHASIVGVPRYLPSYFGLSFVKEFEALTSALKPRNPSLFVIGGAKFETKLPLIQNFAEKYDQVFIGGALANDVFKAKGLPVGRSLVSDIDLNKTGIPGYKNLLLPIDLIVEGPSGRRTVSPEGVEAEDIIRDVGPATLKMLEPIVARAQTILWNGPLGNYELGFTESTENLAKLVAESGANSIVGGGDTVASIQALNLSDRFGFLSTAGGAMLVFLETGTLPVIDAVLARG